MPISDTISITDRSSIDQHRSTVHNWVQKTDLQPVNGVEPDHIAIDENAIQLNDDRYQL